MWVELETPLEITERSRKSLMMMSIKIKEGVNHGIRKRKTKSKKPLNQSENKMKHLRELAERLH